jgi:serine/threonine protein kinase/tetratricopeptide (TPR) repeat protein
MTQQAERLDEALSGRYRIERELGTGGMATVYLARDLKHDRNVALKVLKPDLAKTLGADRFLREIQLAAKLSHPHILPLFDSGEADGALYYVMPNVEGRSLRDRLDKSPQLPVSEAVRIVTEVAGALDYAHRHQVVHRDIKPENIMFQDGLALVADFGIGKALSAVEGEAFTHQGLSVGTPAYMSPEQAAGEEVDGRSDLYSLGCVLYEMLVGEQPFTGPTAQAIITKRFVHTPTDVASLREGVPRNVARAAQRLLARTPIDRYDTAAMFITSIGEQETAVAKPAAPEKSVAVLPFANLSADPENEFFADGITEEILNSLTTIPELRVAGRASSFSFKGKQQDLHAIGEQLNVRTVLEGSVRRSGKRVRISAQLSDVSDGYHLWSAKYDREIEDVFAVQDEIATAIAERMKTSLQSGRMAVNAQRAPENIEAYEAYLKGRGLLNRRGPAIAQGLVMMQRALELDPNYGLAWSGLADTHLLLGIFGLERPEKTWPAARHAAERAMVLAPELAETHASAALVHLFCDWNWSAAEASFLRSMELNPGYSQAATWYAVFYLGFVANRWAEGVALLQELERQDSLSAYQAGTLGLNASWAGPEYLNTALDASARGMALDPGHFQAQWARLTALHAAGEWTRALEVGDQLLATSGRNCLALSAVAHVLFDSGDLEGARAAYAEMQSRARREYMPPLLRAGVAAALGDTAAATALAREEYSRRDGGFISAGLSGAANTRRLRALPEFRAMLEEMKMPAWGGLSEGRR